jgi:rhodanese-related sulfurtransferase
MAHVTFKAINCQELRELREQKTIELIDVRTPEEFAEGRVPGAYNLPLDALVAEQLLLNRSGLPDAPIYFICEMGGRSARACVDMMAAGYNNVVNIIGGMGDWRAAGFPVEDGPSA